MYDDMTSRNDDMTDRNDDMTGYIRLINHKCTKINHTCTEIIHTCTISSRYVRWYDRYKRWIDRYVWISHTCMIPRCMGWLFAETLILVFWCEETKVKLKIKYPLPPGYVAVANYGENSVFRNSENFHISGRIWAWIPIKLLQGIPITRTESSKTVGIRKSAYFLIAKVPYKYKGMNPP